MNDAKLILEIVKCRNDPIYFFENYAKILHPKLGLITPKLYDKQKELVKTILDHPFVIILKSRQIGVSTMFALFSAWSLIFIPDFRIGIVSRSKDEAIEFGEKIERVILNIPVEFWGGTFKENNKLNKKLLNNSEVVISAPVKHALRGETLNYVILDEVLAMNYIDFIYPSVFYTIQHNFINIESKKNDKKESNNDNRPFPKGMSLISTGAIIDYKHLSVHRGAIWFKERWNAAIRGESVDSIQFKPIYIHWRETGFFDEEWYENQKKILDYDENLINAELECKFIEINKEESALGELEEIKKLNFPNLSYDVINWKNMSS